MSGKLLSLILKTPHQALVVCRTIEERDFMRTRAKLCGRSDISYVWEHERVDFVSGSEFATAVLDTEQEHIDDTIAHGARLMESMKGGQS